MDNSDWGPTEATLVHVKGELSPFLFFVARGKLYVGLNQHPSEDEFLVIDLIGIKARGFNRFFFFFFFFFFNLI
jgi:hypothetical protein